MEPDAEVGRPPLGGPPLLALPGNLPAGTRLAAPGVFTIDPDFRNSHTDQATLDVRVGVGLDLGQGRLSVLAECFACANSANRYDF